MTTAVGIDVGKAALDLAIEGAPSVMRFANTKVGIGKLMAGFYPVSTDGWVKSLKA